MTPRPPRVLMVLKRPAGRAGMQIQAARVARQLAARGLPVSFVCGRGVEAAGRLGLPAVCLPGHFPRALYRHLIRHRAEYDVVHVHGFAWEAAAAALAARATGRPLIVKPSTAGPGTSLHRAAGWRGLIRPLVGAVDAWISLSEATREDLSRLGVRPERVVPLPNGVDSREFVPLSDAARAEHRAGLGLPGDAVLLCAVGRLAPHKRMDLLLEAFLSLAAEQPSLHLWLVGSGDQADALSRRAGAHPAGSRVVLVGPAPEERVRAILQAADVFVLPSQWEGLSNALLEAMACGAVPISTRVSGAEDLIWDGENGRLVAPDDEPGLRSALLDVATGREQRARMSAAARVAACAGFSLAETAGSLIDLYREAVHSSTPAARGVATPDRLPATARGD
jgi:glycosyltransferase involved in cell wall biosynthesis